MKKSFYKKWWFWAGALLVAGMIGSSGEDTPSSSGTATTAKPAQASAEDKQRTEAEAKQKAAEEAARKMEQASVKYADMAKDMIPKLTEEKLELSEAVYAFMKANYKLFPAHTADEVKKVKVMADKTVGAKQLNKNATPYANKVLTFAGEIVSVEEVPVDGETVSIVHVLDDAMQSYQVLMYKATGNVFEKDRVRFWGVPVGPSSFQNVSGGATNVQVFIGAHVEKQGQ